MDRVDELLLALDVALNILIKFEPGDSRAVSDEFVAMASVAAGITNEQCIEILNKAIANVQEASKPAEITVVLGDDRLPVKCNTCDRVMCYVDPKYVNTKRYAPCMWPGARGCVEDDGTHERER